ncbi:MAG: CocE/NonD family hydrolase [Solirubrobacterales bacterium]
MRSAGHRRIVWAVAVAALLALAAPASAGAVSDLGAHGSVGQIYVTGADPGEPLRLLDRAGKRVRKAAAGPLGGHVFRKLKPGKGYRVRDGAGQLTPKLAVRSGRAAPGSTAIYDQALPTSGYGYLRTRDETSLAISVRTPAGPPPYPTLVEYSGYGYANPAGAESGISPIANLLGYAVVDVNMRGTGCSGGAFDFFERLQALDGYDVIETVARQPWVMHHKVGMVGVSYGGISQLFVGATRPPSLAAITPLSVIDNTATTLYPGGILNTGFALEWAKDRVEDGQPASPTTGQDWAWQRIQNGDQTCAQNQALHPSAVDLIRKTYENRFYRPRVADPINPSRFVHKIKAPTFLACQFNDEQTGAHCPNLADRFRGPRKWMTFTNGLHIDSLVPETFNRWFDFLELYVAGRRPVLPPDAEALAPVLYSQVMGVFGVGIPPDPIRAQPTYEAAKAAFEAQPRVRVLFDNGGGGQPGHPVPGFERSFKSFPPPSVKPREWFLRKGGALARKPARKQGADSFVWDKGSRPADDFAGTNTGTGDLWTDSPSYDWRQPPADRSLSYVTPPLGADTTVLGGGALYAWVRASVPDVDLQVTVSEVRGDGKETYVQSGWLRASMRRLDAEESTLLEPVLSLRRSDARKLPKGRFTKLTIPLYNQGHAYRAGSRIRVTITPPAGDQPVWSFAETVPAGQANVGVAFSSKKQSKLVLPVLPRFDIPTGLPSCPALRGEPCR